jgi:hypothetical protein
MFKKKRNERQEQHDTKELLVKFFEYITVNSCEIHDIFNEKLTYWKNVISYEFDCSNCSQKPPIQNQVSIEPLHVISINEDSKFIDLYNQNRTGTVEINQSCYSNCVGGCYLKNINSINFYENLRKYMVAYISLIYYFILFLILI